MNSVKLSLLACCVVLLSCNQTTRVANNTSGFGGTGIVQQYAINDDENSSGFGGTGVVQQHAANTNENSSGFGGTGIVQQYVVNGGDSTSGFGGTGIVGNISAFGSIWVNGVEVDYLPNVEIQSNLSNKGETLALGKTVILETEINLNNNQHPTTKKIRIFYPLAGEIQKVEPDKLLLNEQWVLYNKSTYRDKGMQLKAGQYVAVNAAKNNKQQWVASRLNRNPNKVNINKASLKVRFSKNIKKVVLDRRFLNMQKNWSFMSRLRKTSTLTNKSRFKHNKRNPFRQPKNANGQRPPNKKHNKVRAGQQKPKPPH